MYWTIRQIRGFYENIEKMFISKTETFLEPIDVKISTNFDADINNKGPKLKVGDHVRISKYKNKILHNFAPQTG